MFGLCCMVVLLVFYAFVFFVCRGGFVVVGLGVFVWGFLWIHFGLFSCVCGLVGLGRFFFPFGCCGCFFFFVSFLS